MSRPTRSLALPLLAVITVMTSLLMSLAGVLSYGALRSILTTDLRHYGNSLSVHVAAALAHPVWNLDRAQVEHVLQNVMEIDAVAQVSVHLDGASRPEWLERREQSSSATSLPQPVVHRPIVLEGTTLGMLTIEFSHQRIETLLAEFACWIVAGGLVTELLIVAGLSVLLRRQVLAPLREIARYAAGDTTDSALQARRYRGELEGLRSSLLETMRQLEHRHAEALGAGARLEAERSKLRAFFRLVPTGIAMVDADLRVTEANPSLERMLRLSAGDLAEGRHLWREFRDHRGHSLSRDELPSARAMRTQSEILDEEIQVLGPDGLNSWFAVSASPVPGYGAALVVSDITERKEAESRMAQHLGELQRWQKVTLGREERIRQLKAEINDLCRRLVEPPRFRVDPPGEDSLPPSPSLQP